LEMMDIVAGQAANKTVSVGLRWVDSEKSYKWLPSEEVVDANRVFQLARQVFDDDFKTIHGVVYGNGIRRLPTVPHTSWGIAFRWETLKRSNYSLKTLRPISEILDTTDLLLRSSRRPGRRADANYRHQRY
jgi:hypothetical protein